MPACADVHSQSDLEYLLIGFQKKDERCSELFFQAVSPNLRRTARQYLADLPADIREELIGETLMLLQSGDTARFDPVRGSAWNYIHGYALNAVKTLRRMYGCRRRRRLPQAGVESVVLPPRVVSIEELKREPERDPSAALTRHIVVSQILARAPVAIAAALRQVYFVGESKDEVARGLGTNRFALQRQIVSFTKAISMRDRA